MIFKGKVKQIPKVFAYKISLTESNLLQVENFVVILKLYTKEIYSISLESYNRKLESFGGKIENKAFAFYKPGRIIINVRGAEENTFSLNLEVYLLKVPPLYILEFLENQSLKFKLEIKEQLVRFFNKRLKDSFSIENSIEKLSELFNGLGKNSRLVLNIRKGVDLELLIKPIKATNKGELIWLELKKSFVSRKLFSRPKSVLEKK